jgi:hypothetical protein
MGMRLRAFLMSEEDRWLSTGTKVQSLGQTRQTIGPDRSRYDEESRSRSGRGAWPCGHGI